jgi:hypothetical protein
MVKVTNDKVEGFRKFLDLVEARKVRETQFGFDFYEAPYRDEAFVNAPGLFAISMKAPEAGHLIAVSTEIPEEFRKFWAIHEFLEEDKPEYRGRCVDTVREELVLVPEIQKRIYIPLRAGFFRGMVDYARANSEHFTSAQVENFEMSRDYLNQLERSLRE